jgi:hypothetical protein
MFPTISFLNTKDSVTAGFSGELHGPQPCLTSDTPVPLAGEE